MSNMDKSKEGVCVCGAKPDEDCKRPVGMACARDAARAAEKWRKFKPGASA